MLHTGDCVEVMAALDAESIDAVVTDPPYSIGFMSKAWDRQVEHLAWAREALRVARPGAYLLAFGGTRTYHRMTCAIEDAGWIIRDCLVWAYASGFPKSKALLKPAWEPIVMARKPGPLRDLAIDSCRIPAEPWTKADGESGAGFRAGKGMGVAGWGEQTQQFGERASDLGRWPANVILTDPIFDGDTPGVVGGGEQSSGIPGTRTIQHADGIGASLGFLDRESGYGDTGTYSRFFLVPKSARSEREPILPSGLNGSDRGYGAGKGVKTRECRVCGDRTQSESRPFQPACQHGDWEWRDALPMARENTHPTVKPLDLMRHLVRLVTPTGGTVLDPFLGSGTTALAAEMEGFAWVGIEREAEYVAIAEARLNGTQRGLGI